MASMKHSFDILVAQSNQFIFVYTVNISTILIYFALFLSFKSFAQLLRTVHCFRSSNLSNLNSSFIIFAIFGIDFFHICYKLKILLLSQNHYFRFNYSEWNFIRFIVPTGGIFSDHFHFLSAIF